MANRLRYFRERANLSQRELARRTGITHSNISRYERSLKTPTVATLKKLAEALRVQWHKLVD